MPTCCPEGLSYAFTGSRFTSSTETRYSFTEGDLLAAIWALDNVKLFLLGCPNLTIVTNHKPLLGFLNNRDLKRLCTLKKKKHYNTNLQ